MASKRRKRREAERRELLRFTKHAQICQAKQPFCSWSDAEFNMNRLKASRFYDGRALNVYLCPVSSEEKPHYHFGHVNYEDVCLRSRRLPTQCSAPA